MATLAVDLDERRPITPACVTEIPRQRICQVLQAVRGEEVLGLLSFSFRSSLYHAADA